jgi:phytoene dehydrogenase-like protein
VPRAVVVGSGPNGLAAALTLARAGVNVEVVEASSRPGGGTRSSDLTGHGLVHDECSGFHPLALDTAFSREFDLSRYGLAWSWPEVQYAQPLNGGRGASAVRSVAGTAATLGADEHSWSRVFGRLCELFGDITTDFLRPMLHVPSHPVALARFGMLSGLPASVLARTFSTPEARALFGGVAAHAMRSFGAVTSSAIGVALGTAAHTYGWPVAVGGSAAISEAMIRALEDLGGSITTGVRVDDVRDLGQADIVMLDVAPGAAARIAGDKLPGRVSRALRRYRHGPGAYKVDFVVDGDVPWRYGGARRAGTVHLGGSFEEMAASEAAVARGRMPERPFVLVGQQYVADATRSAGSLHPLYAYAHVPAGYDGDASGLIEDQIERFAPGFRERIVARHVRSTADFARHNANYVGGDINGGLQSFWQFFARPVLRPVPYATPNPRLYLCSSSTPPGGGVHGMCGVHAARAALRRSS